MKCFTQQLEKHFINGLIFSMKSFSISTSSDLIWEYRYNTPILVCRGMIFAKYLTPHTDQC